MFIRTAFLAAVRGLALALLSMVVSLVLFILWVVAASLSAIGVGVALVPPLTAAVRAQANLRRRLAHEWFGVRVAEPYKPHRPFQGGVIGHMERYRWIMTDPATWRDLVWMLVDCTAGFTLGILAFAVPFYGPYGLVLAAGVWRPIVHSGGGEWYTFVPIKGQTTAKIAGMLGVVYSAIGVWLSPRAMKAHATLTRGLLGPTRERELALRVERLTETRTDALDTSAAELRRIERDLHDGAQARLVAMGMSLGAIEHLLERDPEKARLLLSEARESSSLALTELRDLVRGIHPPVLAERGLGDAVRALAMASPLKTEVAVELRRPARRPGRVRRLLRGLGDPHQRRQALRGARRVWIDVRHDDGMLRALDHRRRPRRRRPVQGHGPARHRTPARYIRRRPRREQPDGGPTMVTMELPCHRSSGTSVG